MVVAPIDFDTQLDLVRQIAEGQGGFVKVRSQPGQGSTFSLYLPLE